MSLNSLVFTSIRNNIPGSDPRYKKMIKASALSGNDNDNAAMISSSLANTTIKRACCLAKSNGKATKSTDGKSYQVDVKIPIPAGYTPSNDLEKKFGYTTVKVNVPIEYCPKYIPNFTEAQEDGNYGECDKFYGAYCENMKYLYNLENKGKDFSSVEFNAYSRECPCFADIPPDTGLPDGISNSCILPFCKFGDRDAYLDSSSRKKACEGTYCISNTKIGNMTASEGGSIEFVQKNTANCGASPNAKVKTPEELEAEAKAKAAEEAKARAAEQAAAAQAAQAAAQAAQVQKLLDELQKNKTPPVSTPPVSTPPVSTPPGTKTPSGQTPSGPTSSGPTPSGPASSGPASSEPASSEPASTSSNMPLIIGGVVCCIIIIIIIIIVMKNKK